MHTRKFLHLPYTLRTFQCWDWFIKLNFRWTDSGKHDCFCSYAFNVSLKYSSHLRITERYKLLLFVLFSLSCDHLMENRNSLRHVLRLSQSHLSRFWNYLRATHLSQIDDWGNQLLLRVVTHLLQYNLNNREATTLSGTHMGRLNELELIASLDCRLELCGTFNSFCAQIYNVNTSLFGLPDLKGLSIPPFLILNK